MKFDKFFTIKRNLANRGFCPDATGTRSRLHWVWSTAVAASVIVSLRLGVGLAVSVLIDAAVIRVIPLPAASVARLAAQGRLSRAEPPGASA